MLLSVFWSQVEYKIVLFYYYANEDRRSEHGFQNTSVQKMQGFIVVTCSFWGEFELNLYIICLRPQDFLSLTIVRISFLMLQRSVKKWVNLAKKLQYERLLKF